MSTEVPLISVVMPCYRHERYLLRAISSVLEQSLGDLELIVVDDGSDDASPRIVAGAAERDARVRPFLREQNRGISATFNEGIDAARGRFLAFLASDDLWVKDKLERQLALAEASPGTIIYSEALLVDGQGNSQGKTVSERSGATSRVKNGNLVASLLAGNYICLSAALVPAPVLAGLRFDRDLRYLNDYKLLLELARRAPFRYDPEPLLHYRIHGQNASLLGDRPGWSADAERLRSWVTEQFADDFDAATRGRFDRTMEFLARL